MTTGIGGSRNPWGAPSAGRGAAEGCGHPAGCGCVGRAHRPRHPAGVVEIYASDETGSWTILVTDSRGVSCLLAAGESFEEAGDVVKENPA